MCIEFFESDSYESKRQIGESLLPWQNLIIGRDTKCVASKNKNLTSLDLNVHFAQPRRQLSF